MVDWLSKHMQRSAVGQIRRRLRPAIGTSRERQTSRDVSPVVNSAVTEAPAVSARWFGYQSWCEEVERRCC